MTFHLVPVPPFRLDLTAWALRRRPRNLIDRWDGTTYRRAVAIADAVVDVAVRQIGSPRAPRLRVTIAGASALDAAVAKASSAAVLARALGLRVDLRRFYRLASADPKLGPLARAFRGVKPPRFPTLFEALVNAVACQQLSLVVGLELLNRLARVCAQAAGRDGVSAFPRPRELARLSASSVQALGFSRQKTRVLHELAARALAGSLDLDRFERMDNEAALAELTSIPGIGRWSAQYALLRGLGRLDVFPGDDVGARNRLVTWLGRRRPLDYEGVRRVVAGWQPYAGLVYFHMLLAGLAESGSLGDATPGRPTRA